MMIIILSKSTQPFGRDSDFFLAISGKQYTRSSQWLEIGIYQSIKIRKSDLIDIGCIDQLVEIDDTLVLFIDLSRFYRFHRFISVPLFIQK